MSPITRDESHGIVVVGMSKGVDLTPLKINDHTKVSDQILLISTHSSDQSTNTSVIRRSLAKSDVTAIQKNVKMMNIFFIRYDNYKTIRITAYYQG